jgi:hypothetical protein
MVGVPTRTGYSASKHAMRGFFDSLRIELDGFGRERDHDLSGLRFHRHSRKRHGAGREAHPRRSGEGRRGDERRGLRRRVVRAIERPRAGSRHDRTR